MAICSLCNQRKAKRACPALGKQICAVCCGTKRMVEISCPADCVYLASARTHPPAVVQRQREQDRAELLPLLGGLTDQQARLLLMLAALIARHQSETLQKLVDDDIAQATGALAATLETAGRGIVYEHQPASLAAARLLVELRTLVAEVSKNVPGLERDSAIGLRRLEEAAKAAAAGLTPLSAAFYERLIRVFARSGASVPGEADTPAAPASSLIIP